MDNTVIGEVTAEESVQIQQVIQQSLHEIEQMRERMRHDQSEIEASGARTDATLQQIKVQLAHLQASDWDCVPLT